AGLLFGPFGDLYVGSIGTNSILHYDGQTGAFLNAIVTRHDDQIVSGPRQFFFSETSPTTLQYQRRHHHPAPSSPGQSGPGRVLVETAAALAESAIQVGSVFISKDVSAPPAYETSAASGLDLTSSTRMSLAMVASESPSVATVRHAQDVLFGADAAIGSLGFELPA